jgi:[NiFe] hydrogenase diaphorase moiety large subunit
MSSVEKILKSYKGDKNRLLDILHEIQRGKGYVPEADMETVADKLGISVSDVRGVVSFYHFFSQKPVGDYAVYLNTNPVSWMMGREAVSRAFEEEAGTRFGETTSDGKIGLLNTSCIGMNDQEPSAIINGQVFTKLDEEKARKLVKDMKKGKDIDEMARDYYGSDSWNEKLGAGVSMNLLHPGKVIFSDVETGAGLSAALKMKPEEIIDMVKDAGLRGRGGAGFPAGMKWGFCHTADGKKKYIICNADEGEPGTFKDRVILAEAPERIFEGMAIAGYAIGSNDGYVYIRAEYRFLQEYLEKTLEKMEKDKLLGKGILKSNFDFKIHLRFGAGAYVCGEESALIESLEGKRGEPRNRPPFPAQNGYMDQPTTVNNVETYSHVPVILAKGSEWYASIGSGQCSGTKMLSISGDCDKPGVYEIDFGTTMNEVLDMCGGSGAMAVQVGGPSGQCIGKNDFGRSICFNDLATGGSIIVIGPERDLLDVVHNFMDFFVEESCGWCVPCRAGNVILLQKLEKIMEGSASETDLEEISEWGEIVKAMSRCGLGQTSPNPILTTLNNFRDVYESRLRKGEDFVSRFDLASAVAESCEAVGRQPNLEE